MNLVLDTENDGFLDEVTQMWCIVLKDLDTRLIYKYPPDILHESLEILNKAELIICHNFEGYDRHILEKFLGFTYTGKVFDTLVVSRCLNPDRRIPKGCRGGHSLEAWGVRMGRYKPVHEDWSQYSEAMMFRCMEDVEINEWVYYQLLKEMER